MSDSSAGGIMQWIESLVDEKSFLPFYPSNDGTLLNSDSQFAPEVITGLAKVNHRPIAIYAHNPKVDRGYISGAGAIKICRLMERAYDLRIPIVAFLASPGISIEEGIYSGDEYTKVIAKNIFYSGVIPQLAVIISPTLGAPAYSSVLMDMTFFSKHRSFLMVTSPTVVQQAISEKTSMGELGGAAMHASTTGIADFVEDNTAAQINRVKAIIDFLPSSTYEPAPMQKAAEPLQPLPKIPELKFPFNMLDLIAGIVDGSSYIQYKSGFGQAMICAFSYINGFPVGIVANQSLKFSGAIDSDAAQKASRFIQICDVYNIPILTLIDVPGFMPGKKEEQKGLLRHGAKLCFAMQTSVPKISVVVRRCYGAAAFLMMQTKSQGGDLVLALETASIGVMGKDASDKVKTVDQQVTGATEKKSASTAESLNEAYSMGLIDEVLPLEKIRIRLGEHLAWLKRKKEVPRIAKKHSIDP